MDHRTWAALAVLLLTGSAGLGSTDIHLPVPSSATMQADASHPAWEVLRSLGLSAAEWAQLLTQDADANGRTDFLDVLTLSSIGFDPSVELLVYGEQAALDQLAKKVPGAVRIESLDALFLTQSLSRLGGLEVPGVRLLVWEPRAYTTWSTNPSGGSPAQLPQHAISQVGSAWAAGYHGSGIRIGILDTGANGNHQSLSGKVAKFKDCTSSATATYDDHGHGTHVASIAAGNDGSDFKGVADQADLTVVKILDAAGSGTLAQFQCGANYIRTGGTGGTKTAHIASMSAGLGVPPLGITTLNGGDLDLFGWDFVAKTIPGAGTPFTVAAGNWIGTVVDVGGLDETSHAGVNGVNQVSSPGYARSVITVGAVDDYRTPGTFTAIGPGELAAYKPDVVAHGVNTWGALHGFTDRYEQWSGTSMATPIAAGVLALEMGKNAGLTRVTYENALRNGAESSCLIATTTTACYLGLEQPIRPNFTDGYGLVKAMNSLALIP